MQARVQSRFRFPIAHGVQGQLYNRNALLRAFDPLDAPFLVEPNTKAVAGFSIKKCQFSIPLCLRDLLSPRAIVLHGRHHRTAHLPSTGDAYRRQRSHLHRMGLHPSTLSPVAQPLVRAAQPSAR
jgi:hypothetical protein